MRTIEMILMTKSSKYGEYCVAGFECGSGRYIRLISANPQTHGAISREMLFDPVCGRCAEVLDRVCVQILKEQHDGVQTENILIDETAPIRIVGQATIEEAMHLHPCETRDALFSSHQPVVEVNAADLGHSLEFIKAANVRVYRTFTASGRVKHKIDFECGGRTYSQFAMTDPAYYDGKGKYIPQAALMLSISDDEWSRQNGHYIYAAKIFELETQTERKKRGRHIARWLFAAALCSVIGICIAVCRSERVYLPPYSGARYHLSEKCSRLTNPKTAYHLPEMLVKIFCTPCPECAARR